LEYALDVLELDGVSLMSNAGNRCLDGSSFDEVFAELQRRATVVFIHPRRGPPIAHTLGLPDALLDYPVRATFMASDLQRSAQVASRQGFQGASVRSLPGSQVSRHHRIPARPG
jgi:hypothetical protein